MEDAQTKPRQRAPGAGRKPLDPSGEPLVAVNTRMTAAQREKYKLLGGSGWLRRMIDAAPDMPNSKAYVASSPSRDLPAGGSGQKKGRPSG